MVDNLLSISVDDLGVNFTRPIYSGKAYAKKSVIEGKIFVTIRANNIDLIEPDLSRTANVQRLSVELKDIR